MRWPWSRNNVEKRSQTYSTYDPLFASMLGYGNVSGQTVSESTALALSAVWRSCQIISGSIASLPLPTFTTDSDNLRQKSGSFLDAPAGPDRQTSFEWKQLVMIHLLLNGNAYLLHVYNGGGALAGLNPVHPASVTVDATSEEAQRAPGGKLFTVSLLDGSRRVFDSNTLTHIPAMSTDGIRGMSPIAAARNSLGTAIAGDRAAARQFNNGAMVSGLVTTEDDVTEDEAKIINSSLQAKLTGEENAGAIAFINKNLKFTPWTLSAEDAQFLESRSFQVEEISRWFGVPPHLLAQTEKQTSWGTGIAEQNRGLARYTLIPWTTLVEERLSRLIPSNKIVEFDYSAFIKPSPEDEIDLLIKQVDSGLLTLNEARRVRNMPPVEGGDVPRMGFAQQVKVPVEPNQEAGPVNV